MQPVEVTCNCGSSTEDNWKQGWLLGFAQSSGHGSKMPGIVAIVSCLFYSDDDWVLREFDLRQVKYKPKKESK